MTTADTYEIPKVLMVVVGPASHMEPKSPSASASSCSPSRSSSVVEMRTGLGEGRDMSVAIGTGSPVRRSRFRESRLRSARVRLRGATADVPDAGGAGGMGKVVGLLAVVGSLVGGLALRLGLDQRQQLGPVGGVPAGLGPLVVRAVRVRLMLMRRLSMLGR
jgi:hypothetical protein